MSKHFPVPEERRYAQYPRRFLNEYRWGRESLTQIKAKGACATLASAKKHATAAIDVWGYSVVHIFDRLKGEYVRTYRKAEKGILISEGFVK